MRTLLPTLACVALVLAIGSDALAQANSGTTPALGDPIPVEWSNNLDEGADGAGGLGGAAKSQILYTEPNDTAGPPQPSNLTKFKLGGFGNPPQREVDALANVRDLYFSELVADAADLLVSFEGDMPNPTDMAVYRELPGPGPARPRLWTQSNLSNPDPAGDVEDLDALEVWGPIGGQDGQFFSEVAEPNAAVMSDFAPPSPSNDPYVTQATIFAAVASLGFSGTSGQVDVDALMVDDLDDDGTVPATFTGGDTIIFSIRAAANWDGGEIVVLNATTGASFLVHGGHPWDTAFGVAAAFGVNTEEVDAIEAAIFIPPDIPTVSEWGLIIMTLLLLTAGTIIFGRRRRVAVA